MTNERSPFKHRYLGWAALFIAPIMLGARGCEITGEGSECGGLRGEQCGTGLYCDFAPDAACGAADQTGVCRETPEACTLQFDPVCGCDGQTYGNACAANAAGISVASDGECAPTSSACGGLLGAQCGAGEFCSFAPDAQCGAADQTGTCESTPEVCTDIFAPVCGCDDQTYSNACEANRAGVSVASEGECAPSTGGTVCGGLLGAQCADGEFCNFPIDAQCGAADQTGTCESTPEVCTDIFAPVCGCDGNTYANACNANGAGVSVASEGECAPSTGGTACGGLQGVQCADGEFCNFSLDAICGAADQTGTCDAVPDACTREFNPVCGCDDQTYGNACEAHSNGVSVASEGECAPSTGGTVCGGFRGAQCADGEFCNFPVEAICGAADATGTCAATPEICPDIFLPVCGCDGQTYPNECDANRAGVSVASSGECAPSTGGGGTCGGLLGAQCGDGEFCNFARDAFCGAADQTGTCEVVPEVCTFELNPVCGCDGNDYSNACAAHAAGVSVASRGNCR